MDNPNANTNNNPPHSSSATAATDSSTNPGNNTNNRDHFLRHLNKLSHKISKPPPSSSSSSSCHFKPPPQLDPPPPPPQQQQPPVYNINKNDFRDVVQKLTGSPAHPTSSPSPPPPSHPPIHAPKPASSRLQRIRPPPLVQLTTRPPPLLNSCVNPHSPLPPLPTCHAAAESPISAYMRFLHNSTLDARAEQMLPPPQTTANAVDTSGFTWLPSPKSPCPLLSPNLIFSPTGSGALGFPQLPASPTISGVPSPK